MPRLSEPMREALEAAERSGRLIRRWGQWTLDDAIATYHRHGYPPSYSWVAPDASVNALIRRDLLRRTPGGAEITPAGREAIGMKEGEDNG